MLCGRANPKRVHSVAVRARHTARRSSPRPDVVGVAAYGARRPSAQLSGRGAARRPARCERERSLKPPRARDLLPPLEAWPLGDWS